MRTGKVGYYKRTSATDTSTSLTITVHDSDDAIGASTDLHSKVFNKTAKAIPTSSDPLDALELPLFQMTHMPQLTLANRSTPSQMQLALADLPVAHSPQAALENGLCQGDQTMHSDSDSEKNMPGTGTLNPFQMIQDAIPSHARSLAHAKSAAKAAAKASSVRPVAKAKPSSRSQVSASKKRKQSDTENGEREQVAKILKLPETEGSATKSGLTASGSDDKIVADFTEEMQTLRKNVLSCLRDTDPAINDALKNSQKDIGNLLKKIRGKVKSLKRRADNGASIQGALEDMITEAYKVHTLCGQLLCSAADVTIPATLKEISDQDWNVSSAMFKRCFRCASLAFLRVGTWADFTGLQDQINNALGVTNGIQHFELLVSDMIQRLLKSLPTKVSRPEFV